MKTGSPRTWRRPPRIADPKLRLSLYVIVGAYLIWALSSLDVNVPRLLEGLQIAPEFFGDLLQILFGSPKKSHPGPLAGESPSRGRSDS